MNNQAVLVTGASSGIGKACALYLADLGYIVYAGVRKQVDAVTLQSEAVGTVRPVMLDVTDGPSIAAAIAQVQAAHYEYGLRGLVNNAGMVVAGPLEFLPVQRVREQLEVNVLGQVSVTQACIPLLRRARGRVINIGSVAGFSSVPMLGPYAMSKYALEAFNDALRLELHPWGIQVVVIEPGEIDTPIWGKSTAAAEDLLSAMPTQVHDLYGSLIAILRKRVTRASGLPPLDVAKAVARALAVPRPKTRYRLGRDAWIRYLIEGLPDRLRDRVILRRLGNPHRDSW